MVQVVAHDGGGLVEQLGDLGVGLAVEELGQEVGVVAAAGLDELLLRGGALLLLAVDCGEIASRGGTYVMLFVGHVGCGEDVCVDREGSVEV